jgi:hypothetical protein
MILNALVSKATALRDHLLAPRAMREIPSGPETGGDVTPFLDNPDIRKRFGIKQDTARQTTVSS